MWQNSRKGKNYLTPLEAPVDRKGIAKILGGVEGLPGPKTVPTPASAPDMRAELEERSWAATPAGHKSISRGQRILLVQASGEGRAILLSEAKQEVLVDILAKEGSMLSYVSWEMLDPARQKKLTDKGITKEKWNGMGGNERKAAFSETPVPSTEKPTEPQVPVAASEIKATEVKQVWQHVLDKHGVDVPAELQDELVKYIEANTKERPIIMGSSEAEAAIQKFIAEKGLKVKAAEVPKPADPPTTSDAGEAKKEYEIPDDKAMPAVTFKPEAKPDQKMYTATSVSFKDLLENRDKYRLAVWCKDAEEAKKQAEYLEARRADVRPLPDKWPVPKPTEAGKGTEEGKSDGANEKVLKVKKNETQMSPQTIEAKEDKKKLKWTPTEETGRISPSPGAEAAAAGPAGGAGTATTSVAGAPKTPVATVDPDPQGLAEVSEGSAYTPEEFVDKARRLLAKDLGVDPEELKEQAEAGFPYSELALAKEVVRFEMGSEEYTVFAESDAEDFAKEQVEQDLEEAPESFNQDFLVQHMTITETDRGVLANDEADSFTRDMSDEEVVKEAGMDEEWDAEEDDKKKEIIRNKAYDMVTEKKYDEVYESLKDPVDYFVNQLGAYTVDDLMKQNFISIDIKSAAEEAVNTDGAGHYLSAYDGELHEIGEGLVYARWN